jgi:import inner membrane translocase subunit TIM17
MKYGALDSILNVCQFLGGPKAAFGGAVGCAILLGVFEGIGVLMGRMFAQPIPQLPRK